MTYNLHIVLRFEIELALIRGDLDVEDLPATFADGMERLVGIRPPSDALGAMQDIHWARRPVRLLPDLHAGQPVRRPARRGRRRRAGRHRAGGRGGRLRDILGFMRERVHRHGARFETPELMRRATGRELASDALIAHLERSYLAAA